MLTKRTNILFNEETWKKLAKLAKDEEKSVGQLVRVAIDEYYKFHNISKQIREACNSIEKKRKHFKDKINYKALIEYGRKN